MASCGTGGLLCQDEDLGYAAARTPFVAGAPFPLDENYRLAHLPLVAPGHPRVIARKDGTSYERGRHERVVSLVLPVSPTRLQASDTYRALEAELRASRLAPKIAWEIAERRRGMLHATICGSVATGAAPVTLSAGQRAALATLGPLTVELRGLFSGNINRGRLYLRAYPEKRDGANLLCRVQAILGWRETTLYLVGLYNFIVDLDPAEASVLATLIERWWERPILRWQVDSLWLLCARDDLVLDGEVEETIPLC